MAYDLTTVLGGGGSEPPWERILPMSPDIDAYLRYDGSQVIASNADFWACVNNQGAYITTSNISSYTTIVNVTGTGRFGGVVGAASNIANTTNIRVTLDGVVKTYTIACQGLERPVLHIPSHFDGVLSSIGDTILQLSNSSSTVNATAHRNYANYMSITTGNLNAIYFKDSLKVEIQSATARYVASYYNYSGVLYALTD